MAIGINLLWDCSKPTLNEDRFRAALDSASLEDAQEEGIDTQRLQVSIASAMRRRNLATKYA